MKKAWLAVRLIIAVILTVIGTAYANSVVFAQQEYNDFTYEKDAEGIVITGYIGTDESIKIPEAIEETDVKEIGEFAFYRTKVKSIVLPDTVSRIGECAFCRADELENINIPENITSIETGVFSECLSLTEIAIPRNVKFIETGAFGGCISLKRIIVDSQNAYYKDVDGVLYTKDGKALAAYPNGRECESYSVEANTEKIMDFAFYCSNVKTVELPESVTEIGQSAFLKAYLLEKANVPYGVKSIDETTFACCPNLKELIISPDIIITR